LIQGGFCAWCKAGSIFAQDIEQSYNVKKVTKVKSVRIALDASAGHVLPNDVTELTSRG
jgi:hypothetical protein